MAQGLELVQEREVAQVLERELVQGQETAQGLEMDQVLGMGLATVPGKETIPILMIQQIMIKVEIKSIKERGVAS